MQKTVTLCFDLLDLVLSVATSVDPPCFSCLDFFLESQKSASDSICTINTLGVSGLPLEQPVASSMDMGLSY